MRTNYVLIDYENVQVKSLDLLKGEQFQVRIFLRPNNPTLPVDLVLAMQSLGDRGDYILLETPGVNALDFHIAYYLGVLATGDPTGYFHIISKDTGFDNLIKHLKVKKILSARSISIEAMPCFAIATIQSNNVSVNSESKQDATIAKIPVDELSKIAIADLIKRKSSKPRTAKTLLSTIQAKCGKDIPLPEIEAIFKSLVKRGYVKLDGTKVSYALPAEMQ